MFHPGHLTYSWQITLDCSGDLHINLSQTSWQSLQMLKGGDVLFNRTGWVTSVRSFFFIIIIIFGAFLSLIEFLSKFKSCVKPGKAKIRITALPYNSLQRRQLSISLWKRLETKVAGDNKSEREAQIFAQLKQSHWQSAINCVKKKRSFWNSLLVLACFLH